MGAEVEHAIKLAIDRAKPRGNVFRCDLFQERMVAKAGGGAGATARVQGPVEDPHRIGAGGFGLGGRGRWTSHLAPM